jgi:predicted transposase/invertase (TIGR01784 family)
MNSQADTLYKQLFAHPEMLRELLTGFLEADWAATLSVGAFERVNASYASERGKARHDDMVWRVNVGGEWVYVYILLEFQSRSDRWMALRMQVYIGLLYQDLVRQRQLSHGRKFPPVIPVVLYSGRRPWRAATELAELTLPPPEGLEAFQPRQKYLLVEQRWNQSVDVHSNVLAIIFQLLRSTNDADLRAALRLFAERVKAPDLQPARASLMRWLQSTLRLEFSELDVDTEEKMDILFNQRFKRYEDLLEYEAIEKGRKKGHQEGLAEGLDEGRQQGIQQGMQQGMQQGLRLALQDILQLSDPNNGGELPGYIAEKIHVADIDQLSEWIKSLARGVPPRQLFGPG